MTSPSKKRPERRATPRTGTRPSTFDPAWDQALALRRAGRPIEALAALARTVGGDGAPTAHPETRKLRALLHADQAHERELAGDIEGTVTLLQAALTDAPGFPDLHYRLGLARLRLSDLSGARASFEQASRLAPAYAAPRLELALLEARQGRLGESLSLLKRLGETKQPAAEDEFQRGLARLAEADWEGGEEVLRRAFGLDAAPVDARLAEIGALLADGRNAPALALAHALVAEFPYFPDAHLALALVRRERGEWDDCAEACGTALELNPSFHQARVYLAEALSRRGQWGESDFQLAAVFSSEPDHPLAHALAKALRRGGLPGRTRPVPH